MLSEWFKEANYGLSLAVCLLIHKTENVSKPKDAIKERQLWLNLDFELDFIDAPRFGVKS